MISYYHGTLGFKPGQAMLGRDMLFNLTSTIDWRVVNARKQQKVDIDNDQKSVRKFRNDYAIDNLVYMEETGIYHKLGYKKQGPYIINEVSTNGTV